MQSLLLGLGEMIGNAFKAVIMAIVKPVLEIIIRVIITPLINLVVKVISYTIGGVLYVISAFLLQLLDFVEVLFRALAGMESVSASGMSLSLSLDGGSGDILIQLIRHPDIQAAFVSMCVVGLFLLVVTTVFQIIKVEYTTEGAKNAKGPIFQKAFKGLANLMLLPMLVIFGIVFANQLLGLLDTATKGTGDNPTMSGLIFVSSASEAHYRADEEVMEIDGDSWLGIALDGISYGIIELLDEMFGGGSNESTSTATKNSNIEAIENNFISQKSGYRYYNISEVSQYYNYAYINYFLLLFGVVFALKALFFSCFGMVIRLYKCAVLFIISPAVIGMTPVNEGGLGKWRTAFIGQVLSAYGTILSLNLFFIIVRVLLSIEVNFTSTGSDDLSGALTDGLMTLILKMVFVLAGCLLIEKFSKEIGAYFGADDAMGAGKEMAGQVGDLAMKGVGAAAMVASGGAGLAMKGAKMAGGIAGKIGKSGVGQAVGGLGKKIGGGIADKAKDFAGTKFGGGVVNFGKGIGKGLGTAGKWVGGKASGAKKWVSGKVGTAGAWLKGGQTALDARNTGALDDAWNDEFDKFTRADEMVSKMEAKGVSADVVKAKKEKGEKLTEDEQTWSFHNTNREFAEQHMGELDKRKAAAKKYAAEEEEAQIQAKGTRSRKALNAISTVYGLGKDFKGKLPGMKYHDQIIKAGDSGSKALGDEFEAAHSSIEYMKGKRVQDLVHDAPGIAALTKAQNALAAREIMKEAGKEMSSAIETMSRNAESFLQNFARVAAGLSSQEKNSAQYKQMELNTLNSINANGANMTLDTLRGFVSQAEGKTGSDLDAAIRGIKVDSEQHLNVKFDEKTITDALSKAAKNGLTPESIRKELQDVFKNLGKDGEANLMRIITDAIAKVSSQIGGK